jgi:hypothetical protein
MDGRPTKTLFGHDGLCDVSAAQGLLSPPERVRYEPVQLAIAERLTRRSRLGGMLSAR